MLVSAVHHPIGTSGTFSAPVRIPLLTLCVKEICVPLGSLQEARPRQTHDLDHLRKMDFLAVSSLSISAGQQVLCFEKVPCLLFALVVC